MKKIKIILLSITLLSIGLAFSSCGSETSKSSNTEKQGKEYTSAYVCPMHCKDSGSEAAGKCPVCGMDYIANETHKKDGHKHDAHGGHNH